MADGGQVAESAARRYAVLRAHLDERQRRLLLGVEASQLGRGGIKAVAQATGVHPDTIARGVREVEGVAAPSVRVRAPGGGRKKLAETDPELTVTLSSATWPGRSVSMWPPDNQSCRSIPRRRRTWASSRTADGSTNRPGRRN